MNNFYETKNIKLYQVNKRFKMKALDEQNTRIKNFCKILIRNFMVNFYFEIYSEIENKNYWSKTAFDEDVRSLDPSTNIFYEFIDIQAYEQVERGGRVFTVYNKVKFRGIDFQNLIIEVLNEFFQCEVLNLFIPNSYYTSKYQNSVFSHFITIYKILYKN